MAAATVGMGAAIVGMGAVPIGRKPSLWDILYGMGRSLWDGNDLYGMRMVIMGWTQPLWDAGAYYGMRTVPTG